MTVVLLLVHLLACYTQLRAIGDDDIITAVSRWIPYRLMLAAENGRDTRGQAAERRRDEERRVGCRKRTDGGQSMVRSSGGNMVPCARVGKLGLDELRSESNLTKRLRGCEERKSDYALGHWFATWLAVESPWANEAADDD